MKMSLDQWLKNGWLKQHEAGRKEICDLLAIAERDLADAQAGELSNDWKFGIAYNAALKLCAVLLHAEGYKAEKNLNHYRTIQSLGEILPEHKDDVYYLDTCRAKRNTVEYDCVGMVSESDADELVGFVKELKSVVLEWLKVIHPDLL